MTDEFREMFGDVELGPTDHPQFGKVLYAPSPGGLAKRYALDHSGWAVDTRTQERAFRIGDETEKQVFLPNGRAVPWPKSGLAHRRRQAERHRPQDIRGPAGGQTGRAVRGIYRTPAAQSLTIASRMFGSTVIVARPVESDSDEERPCRPLEPAARPARSLCLEPARIARLAAIFTFRREAGHFVSLDAAILGAGTGWPRTPRRTCQALQLELLVRQRSQGTNKSRVSSSSMPSAFKIAASDAVMLPTQSRVELVSGIEAKSSSMTGPQG